VSKHGSMNEGNVVLRGDRPITAVLLDEPYGDTIELADTLVRKYVMRISALHDLAVLEDEGLRKDRQNLLHVVGHVNKARMTCVPSD